jgi:hypothetical protein
MSEGPSAAPDPIPRIAVTMAPNARFGVSTLSGNPDDPTDDDKRLTYAVNGATNNTRVHVDGATPLFGEGSGRVIRDIAGTPDRDRFTCTWSFRQVEFEQVVELVPGEISRRMDAIRVTYHIKNPGRSSHRVGLRVMLDTLIGGNDGVPFIVPGRDGLVTHPLGFADAKVPDFVRSLEAESLANPGVIVDIGLRPLEGERPSEVVLTHWPGSEASWSYDRRSPFQGDSAVGLYYAVKPLDAHQSRAISFTYGLGTISSTRTRNPSLSLTAGGPFQAGGKFWIVALVQHPGPGRRVRITLPEGLSLEKPDSAEQPVPTGAAYAQLSWLVAVGPSCFGDREIKAALEPGAIEERQTFTFKPREARLSLGSRGPYQAGRPFWVSALVHHPQDGQSVELILPPGLSLGPGEEARKEVGAGSDFAQLRWLVAAAPEGRGPLELRAVLRPVGVEDRQGVTIEPRVSRLRLVPRGPYRGGRPFWLSALVEDPIAGQAATLTLSPGLTLGPGESARKAIPAGTGHQQINWLVQVGDRVSGPQELAVTLEPGAVVGRTTVDVEAANLIR